jgi:N-acetylglucosamine malate deacetylase 1
MKSILVLAPHTDDGEFGCGGTLARLREAGDNIFYVAFSTCEKSLPEDCQPDTLLKEMYMATNCLGIPNENVIVYDYPVRDFPRFRQDILENLITLSKEVRPDIVFMPSIQDIHQDHHTIASEAMRAFKKTSILGYELPWNNYSFRNQVFFPLNKNHVDLKISSTKCYRSQFGKNYMDENYILGLIRAHGVQIGVEYAEVFETDRYILH